MRIRYIPDYVDLTEPIRSKTSKRVIQSRLFNGILLDSGVTEGISRTTVVVAAVIGLSV